MTIHFPVPSWLSGYDKSTLAADGIAALIVAVMLIPQSLAYAMLAGAPPEMGLYASLLPLIAYGLLGSSRTLSVGPVAIISLMSATAAGNAVASTGANYLEATVALALLSGAMLLAMGVLRLGAMTNLLSQPVVAGFVTASSIIIIVSQGAHLLGITASAGNVPGLLLELGRGATGTNPVTLAIGAAVIGFLVLAKTRLSTTLQAININAAAASSLSRAAPILAILAAIGASWALDLQASDVAIVGRVPSGLPGLALPVFNPALWQALVVPAFLLALIGYVESVSVGRTLAAKRRQRIEPNRELFGLGAANIAAAVSGGIPVSGGFSRSAINFEAGAQTQMASLLAALGVAVATVFLTPYLTLLPKAALAATIVVSIFPLIDFRTLAQAWRYSKTDFAAVSATILVTLLYGVELGLLFGVIISVLLHLYKTSRPHIAIVGEVPGTEHFRNVKRHQVLTCPHILTLRVDESLYFANAAFVENCIYTALAENAEIRHVVLMCPAINEIDLSALEALEAVNASLQDLGVQFHLSEVKGPVMDALKKTDFLDHLSGKVYLSQHQAIADLDPEGLRFAPQASHNPRSGH